MPESKKPILQFQFQYFLLAVLLFITEILIALFVKDDFIRPHFGDFLVVILIYCSLKAFINIFYRKLAIAVLLFSYLIEILQYFKIVEKIGLGHSGLARVVIGTSFSWVDLLAYTLGIAFVLIVEKLTPDKNSVIHP
jgi:hypothetical protein